MTNIKNQLDDFNKLFKEWKKEHVSETPESCERTFPSEVYDKPVYLENTKTELNFKNFFIIYGCINYEKYYNSPKKVLFILKEPSILSQEKSELFSNGDYDGSTEVTENHWYANLINNKRETDKVYYDNLTTIIEALNVKPEATAMTNINKRGGKGTTKDENLVNYIQKYKTRIMKEINIFNPDIIISCFGNHNGSKELFNLDKTDYIHPTIKKNDKDIHVHSFKKNYKLASGKNCLILGMWHPKPIGKSHDQYKNAFYSIWDYNKQSS